MLHRCQIRAVMKTNVALVYLTKQTVCSYYSTLYSVSIIFGDEVTTALNIRIYFGKFMAGDKPNFSGVPSAGLPL